MVGLNSLMNNVTVIHLPGQPDEWKTKSFSDHEINYYAQCLKEEEDRIHALFEKKKSFTPSDSFYGNRIPSSSSIEDQNVGVSGGVEMVSEPGGKLFTIEEDVDEYSDSMVGPYSLLSVHESIIETLTSSHHFTTITIGERNDGPETSNKKVMSSCKSFVLNAPNKKGSTNVERARHCGPTVSSNPFSSLTPSVPQQTSVVKKPATENKEIQVGFDWTLSNDSDYPNIISMGKDDGDSERGSTPSSFSSAYTVTEQEIATSDTSTSTSVQSDSSSSTSESESHFHSSDDSKNDLSNRPNVSYIFICKSAPANQRSEVGGQPLKLLTLPCNDDAGNPPSATVPFRLRKNSSDSERSSDGSSTCSHRPYQRDKEDDEMWVANEATYSCSLSDYALEWLAPPILQSRWGSNPPELERKSLEDRLLSVVFEPRREVSAAPPEPSDAMTTLVCPVPDLSSLQKKHFASRQRIVDSTNDAASDKEKAASIKDQSWNKENEIKEATGTIVTSTSNNRPTKRFSFLIRSNSLKDGVSQPIRTGLTDKGKMASASEVSASDKAILDRLSQLNLDQTSSASRPRTQPKPQQPCCGRCGEPAYPQEVVRPTSDLVFHTSCFKCFHCGLRLTLATFFRSPVKLHDTRIYCRSHLPAPDGRPNNSDQKSEPASKEIVKCDSIGLRYF